MQIGNVKLKGQVFLAPMSGITDSPFRLICKEMGSSLVCSGMISSQGLVHNNEKTKKLLRVDPQERPVSLQIFGSNPEIMAKAAKIVEEAGADLIDINMGCSVPKIIKSGSGAALMKDLSRAIEIMQAVIRAVKLPVTIKIRKGWDKGSPKARELAKIAERVGVSAITIHPRDAKQGFKEEADWETIKEIKGEVSIPVIGNGDIKSPLDAKRILEETNCDAIMIGRASLGNPWIFKEVVNFLEKGELLPKPTVEERIKLALGHLKAEVKYKGEYMAVRQMRKHLSWYIKGIKGAAKLRDLINKAENFQEIRNSLKSLQG